MEKLCSICGSPSGSDTSAHGGEKQPVKSRSRTKTKRTKTLKNGKSERLSVSSAESFCSALGIPADKFVPVLTNRKKLFCQGCSGHILAIDSLVQQIEELRMQLEWHRKEIEDTVRVRNLCRNTTNKQNEPRNSDYEIIDLILLHNPHLVTIKSEIDEDNTANFPFINSPISAAVSEDHGNDFDIDKLDNTEDTDPVVSYPSRRNSRLVARSKFPKAAKALGDVKPKMDIAIDDMGLDVPSSDDQEDADDDVDYEPEVQQAKRARTSAVKSTKKANTDEEMESPNQGVEPRSYPIVNAFGGGIRLTAEVVAERKKVLEFMERPNASRRKMQKHFRNSPVSRSFRHVWYKEKWIKEIASYEKTVTDAAAGQCPRCLVGFQRVSSLRFHIIDVHPPRSDFICTTCEQPLDTQESLTAHTLLHVPNDKNEYPCLQCGTVPVDLESLRNHTWWHEVKQFKCGKTICDKYFFSSSDFKVHKCRKEDKKFICEECGKDFRRAMQLDRHKMSHSDEKPFRCHICEDYRFKTDFSRVMHLRKIHGYHGPGAKYPPEVPPEQATGDARRRVEGRSFRKGFNVVSLA